ncbi:MAG: ECF transporter S component [Candidatus Gallimonas sp.]
MEKKSFFSSRNIAYLAVLLALVVVLQLFASAIPMFGVTLNFSLIPIALAGILFGAWGGGLLGFVSGLIVFLTAAVMGREPSTAFLFQANPAVLTVICIGKTTLAGIGAGLLYRLIAKKNSLVAAYVSAAVVPVINTGIYMLGIVIMKSDVAAFLGTEATAGVVFATVFGLIWLQFLLEIAINLIFAPAIHRIVLIVEKKAGVKRKVRASEEAEVQAANGSAESKETENHTENQQE